MSVDPRVSEHLLRTLDLREFGARYSAVKCRRKRSECKGRDETSGACVIHW